MFCVLKVAGSVTGFGTNEYKCQEKTTKMGDYRIDMVHKLVYLGMCFIRQKLQHKGNSGPNSNS